MLKQSVQVMEIRVTKQDNGNGLREVNCGERVNICRKGKLGEKN